MMENDYRKLTERITVPEELNGRVLDAVRRTERAGTSRPAGRRWRPLLRGAVCAACALALVLGTVTLVPAGESGRTAPAASGAPVMSSLQYTFGLTALAADTGETAAPNANGGLAFALGMDPERRISTGSGSYTGCLLELTGQGIRQVSLTLDRGEFYRWREQTGLTEQEAETLMLSCKAGGGTCHMTQEGADGSWTFREMTRLGAQVTEDYDPAVRYGLWVDVPWGGSREQDIEATVRACLDALDGAALEVTALFEDGAERSARYRLSAGALSRTENEDGSVSLLPALEGETGAYCGLYAASETDSRWFAWPVEGSRTVSLSFPYGAANGRFHSGIDIPAEQGTPVLAAADGTVAEAGYSAERGNYLVVDHGGGLTTLYGQCLHIDAAEGDTVKAGERIAAVGSTGMSTGPHLHFEVRQDGQAQNPVAYFDSAIRETLRAE